MNKIVFSIPVIQNLNILNTAIKLPEGHSVLRFDFVEISEFAHENCLIFRFKSDEYSILPVEFEVGPDDISIAIDGQADLFEWTGHILVTQKEFLSKLVSDIFYAPSSITTVSSHRMLAFHNNSGEIVSEYNISVAVFSSVPQYLPMCFETNVVEYSPPLPDLNI